MQQFSFFKGLRGQVLTISGIMIFFFIVLTFSSYRSLNSLKGTIDDLSKAKLPQMLLLGQMKASSQAGPRSLWQALASETDEGERAKFIQRTSTHVDILKSSIDRIVLDNATDDQKQLISNLRSSVAEFENKLPTIFQKLEKMNKEADAEARTILLTEFPTLTSTIDEYVETLSLGFEDLSNKIMKESERTYKITLMQTVATSLVASVIAIFVSIFMSNKMVRNFTNITNRVAEASGQVSAASQGLSNSAEQLSADAQSQASAIVETSAAVTEIARAVDANVNASESATQMSEDIHALSQKTKGLMGDLSTAMKSILESNQRIENLVRIIGEIGEKTEIIDEIVFKTQLLSFNASVEAERAGEHGRGFAVVAQEVGNLAQMSGKAATEIASIVKASIREADQVSAENKNRVVSGDKLALLTQEQMNDVISKIEDVLNANKMIVTASKEQRSGLEQVSVSMENLNLITQKSANMSEETSSSSDELKGQSGSLMDLVDELRFIVNGTRTSGGSNNHNSGGGHHDSDKLISMDHERQNRKKERYTEMEDRLKNWRVS